MDKFSSKYNNYKGTTLSDMRLIGNEQYCWLQNIKI